MIQSKKLLMLNTNNSCQRYESESYDTKVWNPNIYCILTEALRNNTLANLAANGR